jgi:hypothetical protein
MTGDITDTLSAEELAELKKDFEVPAEQDSVSLEEFKQSIGKWLIK